MTVYVDDAGIRADVYNPETGKTVSSLWSHLITDHLEPDELHEFATKKLRLRRSYFQLGKEIGNRVNHDPAGDHYDLTSGKARLATSMGAIQIRAEDLAAITVLKRTALRLPDCGYALSQHRGRWFVALEWGQEADDSPMSGAAAYGTGDTIWEAVNKALAEVRTPYIDDGSSAPAPIAT